MDFREQTYEVVMDSIPVTLEVEQPNYWKAIEQAQEAPDVWCLQNHAKSHSNVQISGPQIHKIWTEVAM